MCYVASYLLAAFRVNASSSTKDIKEILDSISIKAEEDQLNKGSAAPAAGSAPTTAQEKKDEKKELEE
ncbi:60S acidic ribosomal protein P2 [Myotis brandtii]|uniref:60S acidic ribosomal protein P2 n=1 Tax=Myotis brandtii TaxID=109478 RepID=S7Q3B6_MYOBR|nr:60S acidic ribosomal protein P2 [Myotis brandtii]